MMSDTTTSDLPLKPKTPYGLLYLAFTLSGAAGLIYEVMWTRNFSLIFGSTGKAAAAVLAAFFAGLAVGGFLGGRIARGRRQAVLAYAATEVVVIVTALAVHLWLLLFGYIYPTLYQSSLSDSGTMTAVKLLLAVVALGPPSVAMGVTLPLLARGLTSSSGQIGRRISLAYGLNTLGATIGVLLAGFALPPLLGTTNTVYLAAGLNLAAAALAIRYWQIVTRDRTQQTDEQPHAVSARPPKLILCVVVISGFGTLALEVIYTRLIINVTDSSVFSFSMMLSAFLVSLAAASMAVSALISRVKDLWHLLAWTQLCGALAILLSPAFFQFAIRHLTPSFSTSLTAYLFQLSIITLVTIGPAVFFIGTALPTAWKIATRDATESGQRVGRLTGFNTLAGVVGSVMAGFVMIPILGLSNSVAIIAVLYAALSIILYRNAKPDRWFLAALCLALLFAVLLSMGVTKTKPPSTKPGDSIIYYQEGEAANVAVLERPDGIRRIKVNNRYTLGSSRRSAIVMQRGQGGLPLLLHPNPQNVAFVGIATGISVSSVLDFSVKHVVAIELIPGVIAAAEKFSTANRGVLNDPRIDVLVADGRNHLFATDEIFDVIVGDLFVPWHAGTGYLYSREHFAAVHKRLGTDGIFAQWLPGHQISVEELRIITATFLDEFPGTEIWISRKVPSAPVIALLGYADGLPTGTRHRASVESNAKFPGLEFVVESQGLQEWASSAQRNTDEFPLIEFSAAASHYQKGENSIASILRAIDQLSRLEAAEN